MPGFTTHYLFGQQFYQALPAYALKRSIQYQHTAYSLGLQGPDTFFYHPLSHIPGIRNLGSLAHEHKVNDLFYYLLEGRRLFSGSYSIAAANAYILGFIAHYTLDGYCHPYIYAKSRYSKTDRSYFGRHMKLETDIDTTLLSYYQGKKPSDFHQDATIALTAEQLDVISTLLFYAYSHAFPFLQISKGKMRASIRAMQAVTRSLHDPAGHRKMSLRTLERIFPGHLGFSAMIPHDEIIFYEDPCNIRHKKWRNPWTPNQVSRESFYDLLSVSAKCYEERIFLAYQALHAKEYSDLQASLNQQLLKHLGNSSYHSGLPL